MTTAALQVFKACARLATNLNEVCGLVQNLSASLHSDPGRRAEFSEIWASYLIEEVRENSGITQGHSKQHYAGMPYDECRHCMGRVMGPMEMEALEEAIGRMLYMVV